MIIANLATLVAQASYEESLAKNAQSGASAFCRSCCPENRALTTRVLRYFTEYHKFRPALDELSFLQALPGWPSGGAMFAPSRPLLLHGESLQKCIRTHEKDSTAHGHCQAGCFTMSRQKSDTSPKRWVGSLERV